MSFFRDFASLFMALAITFSANANPSAKPESCLSCHQDSHNEWLKSDHAKAMLVANEQSVVANFDNQTLEYFDQKVHFYKSDDKFKASIQTLVDGKASSPAKEYTLAYTFGFYPLQQFLVNMPDGKKQVFPFTWDARTKEEGGQRWYHLHSTEFIDKKDRLHWLQPLQNWNGMCADCHSDGLERNYDAQQDSFNTTWDNINVGCASCHTQTADHYDDESAAVKKDKNATPAGFWQRHADEKIAHWQGSPRNNEFMDNCYACHSLRSPLTDGFKPNNPFLNQFMPEFLLPPLYHADGQIKEEVYVHGSFKQSKMYEAGVNCLDCHDKHSYKVKTQDNALCLQCHDSQTYNQTSHHKHAIDSEGAQCVSCHMPTTTYMGVDDRRDHSFPIPRPALSEAFGVPNACTQCHDDKSNQWASQQLKTWYGSEPQVSRSLQKYMKLHSGQGLALSEHLALAKSSELDVMKRATVLRLLAYNFSELTAAQLKPFIQSQEDLIRLAATQVANLVPANSRVALLKPLLGDEYAAIRIASVQALLDSNIAQADLQTFKQAYDEYQTFNSVNSWRGEGRVNVGNDHLRAQKLSKAIDAFKMAIEIEPYFDVGYINLADIYRAQQNNAMVASVLQKGIANLPKSASIRYSYALHLVRVKNYEQALEQAKQASGLEPQNSQYLYTYALLLDNLQQTKQAVKLLLKKQELMSNNPQLKELGLYFAQKLGDRMLFQRISAL
ncbi:cytochrome c3 family protein [Catenovulum sediminis]|uniref:Multiheme c-type cytochrome n=1 Tax=Catenovulum sediminis TaxID=1740262 RepID=A0ABV1RIL8_9ALTE